MKTFFHYLNIILLSRCIYSAIEYGDSSLDKFLTLAIFQIFYGFAIVYTKAENLKNFKEIKIYFLAVVVYFILIIHLVDDRTVKLLIIPLLIASYNCYVTYKFINRPFLKANWKNLVLIKYEMIQKIYYLFKH